MEIALGPSRDGWRVEDLDDDQAEIVLEAFEPLSERRKEQIVKRANFFIGYDEWQCMEDAHVKRAWDKLLGIDGSAMEDVLYEIEEALGGRAPVGVVSARWVSRWVRCRC
jgi:hypothetical protein